MAQKKEAAAAWPPVEAAAGSVVMAHPGREELEALGAPFAAFMRSRGTAELADDGGRDALMGFRESLEREKEEVRLKARLFTATGRVRDPRYRHGADFCPRCGRYKDYAKECPACGHLELTL